MLKTVLATCACWALSSAWAQGEMTDALYRDDGSPIEYYLQSLDPNQSSRSLLVVVQGSDCNSVRQNRAISEHLSKALPTADMLTIEKYGIDASLTYNQDTERVDCPAAFQQQDSLEQRVQDYRAVISHLRQKRGYQRVVAIGGSEGAVVVNLLAAQQNYLDASIAFNGGGQWFIDDVLHSIDVSSIPEAQKLESAKGIREFAAHIMHNPPSELVVSNHGYAWWKQMLELDQLAVLQNTHSPVLIIQGGADQAVSTVAVTQMVEKLKQSGKSNIEYRTYLQLDHRLNGSDGISQFGAVVEDMATWLQANNVGHR
ncbi:alpha/beta hydrolase family protein [Pseudomonas tructae]|nr:prolyl oligopeptidase family serine peptidase [Pseudomonas tructae]